MVSSGTCDGVLYTMKPPPLSVRKIKAIRQAPRQRPISGKPIAIE
jgi:hypothetical protein